MDQVEEDLNLSLEPDEVLPETETQAAEGQETEGVAAEQLSQSSDPPPTADAAATETSLPVESTPAEEELSAVDTVERDLAALTGDDGISLSVLAQEEEKRHTTETAEALQSPTPSAPEESSLPPLPEESPVPPPPEESSLPPPPEESSLPPPPEESPLPPVPEESPLPPPPEESPLPPPSEESTLPPPQEESAEEPPVLPSQTELDLAELERLTEAAADESNKLSAQDASKSEENATSAPDEVKELIESTGTKLPEKPDNASENIQSHPEEDEILGYSGDLPIDNKSEVEPIVVASGDSEPAKDPVAGTEVLPEASVEGSVAEIQRENVDLSLSALMETAPSVPEDSRQEEGGKEVTDTELEEAAALLAVASQLAPAISEADPSKKDEPMQIDDWALTSLPTLISDQSAFPNTETQSTVSEQIKKEESLPILDGSEETPKKIQTAQILRSSGPISQHTSNAQLDQAIAQITKKEPSESDDLATLANAALGDSAANGVKVTEDPSKKEPLWCDVGIIKGTSCHVMSYYDPGFNHDPEHENISVDNLPDYTNTFKIDLEPGTAYKFRVCAINSCGRGPWSEVSAFKTCLPGYPGAPSSIKISKSAEGAHLSWEPPSNPAGNIIEYSVCLAVRNPPSSHGDQKNQQQLAFVRVYSGPHNQTVVLNSSLAAAHIDTTSKPAIIFRIAAKNEKGFGPATQVRWLQDVVASPGGGVKPMIKKEPIASGVPMKRAKIEDF